MFLQHNVKSVFYAPRFLASSFSSVFLRVMEGRVNIPSFVTTHIEKDHACLQHYWLSKPHCKKYYRQQIVSFSIETPIIWCLQAIPESRIYGLFRRLSSQQSPATGPHLVGSFALLYQFSLTSASDLWQHVQVSPVQRGLVYDSPDVHLFRVGRPFALSPWGGKLTLGKEGHVHKTLF